MKTIICLIAISAMATGCATKPYTHGSITDPMQLKKQMAIDDGECTRQASTASPSRQNIYIEDSRGNGGGFSKGFNAGGGSDVERSMTFRKIHYGCMLSKGWSKAE